MAQRSPMAAPDDRDRRDENEAQETEGPSTVPAARVATRILDILLDTGDDAATVAQGLDVEADWVIGVLTGEITAVDVDHVQRLCEAMHCTPFDLFGSKAGRSIIDVYGPELWPRYIDPLEPIGWETDDIEDLDAEFAESRRQDHNDACDAELDVDIT